MKIYLIGSLRNPQVPVVAKQLREAGHEVFDDWYAAGPEADDKWKEYEQARGRNYIEGLAGNAAQHVFEYDKSWLDWADACVLLLPAGRSGHLEFGYMIGKGKPGYIVLPEDHDRWDVMYKFATAVLPDVPSLLAQIPGLYLRPGRFIPVDGIPLESTTPLVSGLRDKPYIPTPPRCL